MYSAKKSVAIDIRLTITQITANRFTEDTAAGGTLVIEGVAALKSSTVYVVQMHKIIPRI